MEKLQKFRLMQKSLNKIIYSPLKRIYKSYYELFSVAI